MMTNKYKKGFSLIELIIYLGILTMLIMVSMTAIISITKSFGRMASARVIHSSAITSYDRLSNEIRSADVINSAGSIFGSHPGALSLTKEGSITIFSLENGKLKVSTDGVSEGYLTKDDVVINSLIFEHFDQGGSEAVTVSITFSSEYGTSTRVVNFQNTFKLRGTY